MEPSDDDKSTALEKLTVPPSTLNKTPEDETLSRDHGFDEERAQGAVHAEVPEAPLIWNKPRINLWRFLVALFSFLNMGANDAAYGALIPYLERYYHIDYTIVALVFLSPFIGYTLAAFLNHKIHMRFGQRGIAIIAPCCKLVAYIVTCNHPPYPVLPVIFTLSGFGNGLEDGGWNAWVGGMANANEVMGFLHGFYGLGATISPLIATSMVAKADLPWYTFYYVLVGAAVLELVAGSLAFWQATGQKYRRGIARNDSVTHDSSSTREVLTNRITWLVAFFLLCYVGVEVSLGGWLVEFMLRVRHGRAFESGLVVTGYWLGLTIGRVILGFVTGRIGEKFAIAIYLLLSMGLELLFWLVPSFISSAIFAALLGFFLGPLFPAAILVASKLLPRHLHVSAIGFAAAFGGGGAAVLPFAVGAIAQAKGVQVLQPIVLAFLASLLAIWAIVPGGFRKKSLEDAGQASQEQVADMHIAEDGIAPDEKAITRFRRLFRSS